MQRIFPKCAKRCTRKCTANQRVKAYFLFATCACASSVMQSACARCKQQTRFDTLICSVFPCAALRTLWENTLQKFRKSFAHQKTIGVQHKRTRLNSVSVPCLQIRVGRFDSGPRLHKNTNKSKRLPRWGMTFKCVEQAVSFRVEGQEKDRLPVLVMQSSRQRR